ncbi:MAG: tRNA (adenosine(37)-N6)-threonylcarbamoyltransferase complex dimerization subunit type 1 TsaB [Candidatus Riflebacteria bacterium]|nr:tRNA (adenosine(37)-N6)-threonylcarbamoyltransferase complex dimerization subunit type 1 TsaB [Candidatus Riflebacteria bacterium]
MAARVRQALAVHSTSRGCHAALLCHDGRTAVASAPQASSALPGMVTSLLSEAGLTLADLELLAVARGPGSFTGIKISIACVWALARAARLPMVGVGSLEALAAAGQAAPAGSAVLAVAGAYGGKVYAGRFVVGDDGLPDLPGQLRVGPPSCLADLTEGLHLAIVESTPEAGLALPALGDRRIVSVEPGPALAEAVVRLAGRSRERGVASPADPLYLRADPGRAW